MIFVYRRRSSSGARELTGALGGIRLRDVNGVRTFTAGDTVVCWGEALPDRPGVRVLNGTAILSKFADAQTLRTAGISTIEVSRTRPLPVVAGPPPPDPALSLWEDAKDLSEGFDTLDFARGPVMDRALQEMADLFTRLRTAISTPPPAAVARVLGDWVPRLNNHVGGNDLLAPPTVPEFFVKKETFTQEYRVHSFNGLSIRAGIKVPREGMTPHAWIRSFDGGWRINYDAFQSTRPMRDLAAAAISALHLQFGAVDIGQREDGTLVVLECNRAPGLEGGTVTAYASAIQTFLRG